MLKTNSRIFKNRLQEYFLQCMTEDHGPTPEQKTKYFFNTLLCRVKNNYEPYRVSNYSYYRFHVRNYKTVTNVKDLLCCVFGGFSFAKYDIIYDLSDLMSETEQEKQDYFKRWKKVKSDTVLEFYALMVLRAGLILAKKYKIEV